MKTNEIMKSVSLTFNKVGFRLQKKSPEILVAAGVVGIVAVLSLIHIFPERRAGIL